MGRGGQDAREEIILSNREGARVLGGDMRPSQPSLCCVGSLLKSRVPDSQR